MRAVGCSDRARNQIERSGCGLFAFQEVKRLASKNINKVPESKAIGTSISLELIDRLRFESARSRTPIRKIITAALEAHLPKDIRIVVGKEK